MGVLQAMETRLSRFGPATQAILRIGAALLFMQHGAQKMFGMFGGIDGAGGTVELMSRFGAAGLIETVGAALLLIGFLTRPVGLIIFVEMLAAHWLVHMPQGGVPVQNGGELPLLYALIGLFYFANGAGPWSVDRALTGRKARTSGGVA